VIKPIDKKAPVSRCELTTCKHDVVFDDVTVFRSSPALNYSSVSAEWNACDSFVILDTHSEPVSILSNSAQKESKCHQFWSTIGVRSKAIQTNPGQVYALMYI